VDGPAEWARCGGYAVLEVGYEPGAGNVDAEAEEGTPIGEVVPPNADGVLNPGRGCITGTLGIGGGVNVEPAIGVR